MASSYKSHDMPWTMEGSKFYNKKGVMAGSCVLRDDAEMVVRVVNGYKGAIRAMRGAIESVPENHASYFLMKEALRLLEGK